MRPTPRAVPRRFPIRPLIRLKRVRRFFDKLTANFGLRPKFVACGRVDLTRKEPLWVPFTLSSLPPACSAVFFDSLAGAPL